MAFKNKETKKEYMERIQKDYQSKELIRTRCQKNQEVLNAIFDEIEQVCDNLRETKDRHSRATLESRLRYLSNKYSFSSSMDETISFK